MQKMKTNEMILLFLFGIVAIFSVLLGLEKWTNLDVTGSIAFLTFIVIGLPILFVVYMLIFNLNQIEKKHYAAIFFIFGGIIAFGWLMNSFGYLPDLFSAGITGLQSMIGVN